MILLTGGSGFIGTNTLDRLNRRGRGDVVVVDDIGSSRKWRHLSGREFLRYLPREELWEWLSTERPELEAVIHLGACTDTTEDDFDYLTRVNTGYSIRLWSECVDRRVPFIYASSAATYGDGALGFSDRRESPAELAELEPLNPYGLSKHAFDLWVARRNRTPPRWAGLKFFNVYGPHEEHKGAMASYVWQAIEQARREGRVRLYRSHRPEYGHGEQRRDFVFVDDVVEVVLSFAFEELPSGLYNVGTGTARTFNELVEHVFDALGSSPEIEYFDMPEHIRGRYQYHTEAETGKLEDTGAAPGWTPLGEGVRRTVEWIGS